MGQRLHFWLTWRAVLVIIFLLPNTKPNGKGQYCCGGNPMQQPGPVSMDHVLLALQETKEERDQRIRGLFNFFDARGAGHLDYAQIEAGLSALHIPSEYKYAKDLLNVCDANKHGRVDYQEFRCYMDNKELELYCIFQAIDVAHHGGILPVELYDALVRAEPGPLVQQGCGMISGALGAICVYPLQVIRTRMQAQHTNADAAYKGTSDAFRRTFQHEGFRGFYKGIFPNILKVVPSASITYLVYETMQKALDRD